MVDEIVSGLNNFIENKNKSYKKILFKEVSSKNLVSKIENIFNNTIKIKKKENEK